MTKDDLIKMFAALPGVREVQVNQPETIILRVYGDWSSKPVRYKAYDVMQSLQEEYPNYEFKIRLLP